VKRLRLDTIKGLRRHLDLFSDIAEEGVVLADTERSCCDRCKR
jgi:hypothetical protein